MLMENKYRNYSTCDFIAVKLSTFLWEDSISELKRNTIGFIDSFGEYKYSIATLSVHVLHGAIAEKELHELKLDLKLTQKLKSIIETIINHVDPVLS